MGGSGYVDPKKSEVKEPEKKEENVPEYVDVPNSVEEPVPPPAG